MPIAFLRGPGKPHEMAAFGLSAVRHGQVHHGVGLVTMNGKNNETLLYYIGE